MATSVASCLNSFPVNFFRPFRSILRMSARPEHEDDGNATEMSNLQDAPKESQDSQAGLHGDPERQDYRKADRDQNAAYRK